MYILLLAEHEYAQVSTAAGQSCRITFIRCIVFRVNSVSGEAGQISVNSSMRVP